jgi:hypothetical protein
MDRAFWFPISLYVGTGIVIFAGRNLIKSWIEKGIQHRFDARLEELRAEFRAAEEELKSDLRIKEADIIALRDGPLSGRTQRQALVDARRIDAIQKLWEGIVALTPFKGLSAAMAPLNVDALAKRANEPKVKEFIGVISTVVNRNPDVLANNPAKNERPFVSPLAWAYFFAYLTIVSIAFANMKLLEVGTENLSELFAKESIRNFLKTVLPHRAEFIDRNEPMTYYYLLDEIEVLLLEELQKMLRGEDLDTAGVEQAARIMEMARTLSKEPAAGTQAAAAAVPAGH